MEASSISPASRPLVLSTRKPSPPIDARSSSSWEPRLREPAAPSASAGVCSRRVWPRGADPPVSAPVAHGRHMCSGRRAPSPCSCPWCCSYSWCWRWCWCSLFVGVGDTVSAITQAKRVFQNIRTIHVVGVPTVGGHAAALLEKTTRLVEPPCVSLSRVLVVCRHRLLLHRVISSSPLRRLLKGLMAQAPSSWRGVGRTSPRSRY